jgi:hypothetical protein
MIDLLPLPQDRFACPCGQGELNPTGFRLVGMMPGVRCRCAACGRRFLAHLHIGFGDAGDFLVDEDSGEIHTTLTQDWYITDLTAAVRSLGRTPNPVRTISRRPLGADVVIANCLDPTYGHCVRRLYSIDEYRQKGFAGSIVAIVPAFLEWQVPEDVDEIWSVDAPSYQCHLDNAHLAAKYDELAARAAQLRYGHIAYAHTIDISRYVRATPFAATGHDSVSPPRLTLNWREDRCWTARGAASADAVAEQCRLYTLLLETLRQHVPDLDATVTGYGQSGSFPSWVQDLRLTQHEAAMERRWAERYAVSHLVFGMHGSNMNIPAALARGAMEIVEPKHWYSIGVSWQWINRISAWDAVGRYRQMPLSASVSDIVSAALIHLRRLQNGVAYDAAGLLGETVQSIARRHPGAFLQPAPVICCDAEGRPF